MAHAAGGRRQLPSLGSELSLPEFVVRHRILTFVAAAHAPVLVALGVFGLAPFTAAFVVPAAIAALVFFGADADLSRGLRSLMVTVALLLGSGAVVAVAGGTSEAQLLFLVVVALVACYGSWRLVGLCVGAVAVLHTVVALGWASAQTWVGAEPLLWAGLHVGAVGIVGASMLAAWHSSESDRVLAWESGARPTYGVDARGVIQNVNHAMTDALGVDVASLVARDHHDLLHLGAADACELCEAVATGRKLASHRTQLLGSDGSFFDAEISVRPIGGARRAVGATVTFTDITEQISNEHRLAQAARTDALTGLGNRFMLDEDLPALIEHETELGRRLGMIHLNVDRFRPINDTFGHAVGDAVLLTLAQRLQGVAPSDALIARIGGDEFVVVVPDALPDAVMDLAERVRSTASDPIAWQEQPVSVTVSIGVVVTAAAAADAASLMADVDLALRSAKLAGGDRVARYDLVMRARADARIELATDLHGALASGAFALHFQPIWRLGERRIDGCEALLRWDHPERGRVPPDTFVPLAEETGVIVPLGRWVIAAACRKLDEWHAEHGLEDLRVAVNLSAMQLRDAGLVAFLDEVLDGVRFPPDRLVLELTESVLIEDLDAALPVLAALRARGIVLSIDDFGTGFSSLSMLRHLPVDEVKIDRQFIQGLSSDPLGQRVVASVIDLARTLGLRVVAEGIETGDDLRVVERLGAELAQGFALGEPDVAEVIEDAFGSRTMLRLA